MDSENNGQFYPLISNKIKHYVVDSSIKRGKLEYFANREWRIFTRLIKGNWIILSKLKKVNNLTIEN